MSSKKISSPLLSIFQQWTAQQRQTEANIDRPSSSLSLSLSLSLAPHSSSSYRILLQTSYSLQARISAAEPVENPHLYKHAGVTTPSERATRDIYGGSETAWLLRLVELAVQQSQNTPDDDASCNDTDSVSIIFLTTKARSQDYSIIQELPHDSQKKVRVIDFASRDPFGWDGNADGNTNDNNVDADDADGKRVTTSRANISNLGQIYRKLQEQFGKSRASGTPVILIWQSLTPLILVHGFQTILRLLCALPTCLQVWPVDSHIMTPEQHAWFENVSNALLCMRGGEMNIVRQGIRERGNIIRQKLPFRLVAVVSNSSDGRQIFRIVEESEDENGSIVTDNEQNSREIAKSNNKSDGIINTTDAKKAGSTKSSLHGSSNSSRSRGIQLRIEENDGGRSGRVEANNVSENEVSALNRPRIYLQDDDPEFDDFDEEDPDEDLEI